MSPSCATALPVQSSDNEFCVVGCGKILKQYCLQCRVIFIWPKQLAKCGQVQIHGLLLGFAAIQIQISKQVTLT